MGVHMAREMLIKAKKGKGDKETISSACNDDDRKRAIVMLVQTSRRDVLKCSRNKTAAMREIV